MTPKELAEKLWIATDNFSGDFDKWMALIEPILSEAMKEPAESPWQRCRDRNDPI